MPPSADQTIRHELAQFLQTTAHSQREFAAKAGVDPSQLGRFLAGTGGLSQERLTRVASALAELVGEEKSRRPTLLDPGDCHELATALRGGRLTLIAGAGLSRQAIPPGGRQPLPLWGELAAGLVREVRGPEELKALEEVRSTPLEMIDYLEAIGDRIVMVKQLRETLLNTDGFELSPAHRELARLNWKAVLTTNYDGLLADALKVRYPMVAEQDFVTHQLERTKLVHLNGDLRDPHTLCSRDFQGWEEKHPLAYRLLTELVTPPNRTLFVGYSFSDPFLTELIGWVRAIMDRLGLENVIHAWMWRTTDVVEKILFHRYKVKVCAIHHDYEWAQAFQELGAAARQHGVSVSPISSAGPKTPGKELRQRYREKMVSLYASANLSGLYVGEAIRADDVRLDEVFVWPSMEPITVGDTQSPSEERGPGSGRFDLDGKAGRGCRGAQEWLNAWEGPGLSAVGAKGRRAMGIDAQKRRLVILGGPGSGKSSLLQQQLLKGLEEWEDDPTRPFPVYLRLSHWEADAQKEESFLEYAVRVVAKELEEDTEVIRPWFTSGPVRWLLDGVDEIRDARCRHRLLGSGHGNEGQLDRLSRAYDGHQWVVTSRPTGYHEARLPATWTHLQLSPLENSQAIDLLRKWSLILQRLHRLPHPYFDGEEVFSDLGAQAGLSQLRRNPLLLTMIVLFYRDNYRLPRDRWEFYTHASTSLRLRWARTRSRNPSTQVSRIVERSYYATLLPMAAIEAFRRGTSVFAKEELTLLLNKALKSHGYTGREADEETVLFFSDAVALIGIIVERGLGLYGFLHLTFQEFFAAEWLRENHAEAKRLMASHGLHPDWREVWELYALGLGNDRDKLDELHESVGTQEEAMATRLRWLGLGRAAFPEEGDAEAAGALTGRKATLAWGIKTLQSDTPSNAIAALAEWEREYHPEIRTALTNLLSAKDNKRAHAVARALGEQSEGRELRVELIRRLCGEDDRERGFAELALSRKIDHPRVRRDVMAVYHGFPPEGMGTAPSTLARAAAARVLGGEVPAVFLWDLKDITTTTVSLAPGVDLVFVRIPLVDSDTVSDPRHEAPELWMAQTQITQAQWRAVMVDNPDPSRFKGIHRPVEGVSWNDICTRETGFLARLNRHPAFRQAFPAGAQAYLPSSAQWERACRAGTKTPYHFGPSLGSHQANFDGNFPEGDAVPGVYREETVVVGSFPPNAFGLFDMHGNVWEWCQDQPPKGYVSSEGSVPVLRGGCWFRRAGLCASSIWHGAHPGSRINDLGFRPAVSIGGARPPGGQDEEAELTHSGAATEGGTTGGARRK